MLSLLWFRRDLRIEDNLSLNLCCSMQGKIQPIFIFDENILERFSRAEDRRISFILDALRKINKELEKHNTEVLVFYGKPEILVPKISSILNANKVYAGKDYEPYGLKRDLKVSEEVDLILCNDHLLIDPEKLLKSDGKPYKVFTPYFRQWLKTMSPLDYADYTVDFKDRFAHSSVLKDKLKSNGLPLMNLNDGVPGYNYEKDPLWSVENIDKKFSDFIDNKLKNYTEQREFMGHDGTSCLSPYLRFGLISIRKCYREAFNNKFSERWINELAWRDFYAMILYHFPETITQEMQPQYRALKWSRDEALFEKFCKGQTGFPIVDAAINQLLQTGWMHNRARMIVASFMTKNLWLDWRMGEEFFAQHLMDYELSSNVGGWQWSASVGTDAQPYFRIFNPYLQGQRFDPDGEYIRKFLPQLSKLDKREIHKPSELFSGKYFLPIVDYDLTRKRAIESFKKIVSS